MPQLVRPIVTVWLASWLAVSAGAGPAWSGIPPVPPAGHQEPQAVARRWLVVVDALHLDFTRTGHIRAALAAIVRPMLEGAVLAGVRTLGPSQVALDTPPGAGWDVVAEAIKQVTGNGLKATDIVPMQDATELVARARQTKETLEAFLHEFASPPLVVMLVSNGYRTDAAPVAAELSSMADAAKRAGVPLVILDSSFFLDELPSAAPLDSPIVRHRLALAGSLERLARDTHGALWQPGDSVASVLRRLR